ncbi:DNA-directed RNA polymerase sigma-70 factor [Bacteroidia bacterium]|nr:DNA-directed RNA polymerase sigma-70 factor [Bacteroidia bacterium]GHT29069.1 DNA-directed RNA polymerase sigma-70 factor [Bacteroidia bacterium]GHU82319.1 DNA-directed RNA polymerase sigma-70 factor [Bacteroidia bacterium]
MDEKSLISAVKNGSESAFKEIYNAYWQRVFLFASLYITDKDEVRDIVQDVFVKLWESRSFLREEENFKGYLFIITRNHVFNKSRSAHFNYDFYRQTIDNALEHSYRIEDELEAEDLEKQINRLIEEMPSQRRRVFILSRKQYKSYKEIAAVLNISEKTVERHINEAIKYIKTNLQLLSFFIFFRLF